MLAWVEKLKPESTPTRHTLPSIKELVGVLMSLPHDNDQHVPPRVSSLIPVPRAPHTLTMCKLVVDNYVTQKILLEIALVSVQ